MEDLIQKYGGLTKLTQHIQVFYDRVCDDKGVKHYFFGIKPRVLISDLTHYKSFAMQRPEHFYRDVPAQTSSPEARVNPHVFTEILKHLEKQLKTMGVDWREIPRFAHHLVEMFDETRSQPADTVKSVIPIELVSLDNLDKALQKKGVLTRQLESGALAISRSYNLAYPFELKLDLENKLICFIGKAYSCAGATLSDHVLIDHELQKLLNLAHTRFPFLSLNINYDDEGCFLEMTQSFAYTTAGIPTRMLLNVAKDFSWRFAEVMALDKDKCLINVLDADAQL